MLNQAPRVTRFLRCQPACSASLLDFLLLTHLRTWSGFTTHRVPAHWPASGNASEQALVMLLRGFSSLCIQTPPPSLTATQKEAACPRACKGKWVFDPCSARYQRAQRSSPLDFSPREIVSKADDRCTSLKLDDPTKCTSALEQKLHHLREGSLRSCPQGHTFSRTTQPLGRKEGHSVL